MPRPFTLCQVEYSLKNDYNSIKGYANNKICKIHKPYIFFMLDHILDMPYEYLLKTIRFANEGAKPYSFLIISFRLVNKLLMVVITKMDNLFFQACYA